MIHRVSPFTPSVRVSLRQHCDDACDTVHIDHNRVAPKWVATPFSSNSIVANETVTQASSQRCRKHSDARCKWALNDTFGIKSLSVVCIMCFTLKMKSSFAAVLAFLVVKHEYGLLPPACVVRGKV